MGAGDESSSKAAPAISRLKREDYKRTKHDSHFSKWQVLIGASDWEDYSQGKEGVARYRVHNLPTKSGPGLYELGIAVTRRAGSDIGKLDPDEIVVVYLGQADNVRNRLQRYGRSGAHLGNSYANNDYWNDYKFESEQKGPGLFEEIFQRGHSIVFRWASMKDKRRAEKTEAQLLDTFDYAWNKGSNGVRRPNDILQKLSKIASTSSRFSTISKRILFLAPGRVGIRIEANKPISQQKCTTIQEDEDGKSFLQRIFKFSRFQPRLVSDKCDFNEDFVHNICGFIMNDGIPCRQPPVKGRKRCEEHKGMRIYGFSNSNSNAVGNSDKLSTLNSNSSIRNEGDNKIACGVNLGDGNFCRRQPVSGRKRCEEHKGMRIKSNVHVPSTSSGSLTENNASSEINSDHNKLQFQSSNGSCINDLPSTICGVPLKNGSVCLESPVRGRKRCEQHKGMRVSRSCN